MNKQFDYKNLKMSQVPQIFTIIHARIVLL